jgi:hypothetical protein
MLHTDAAVLLFGSHQHASSNCWQHSRRAPHLWQVSVTHTCSCEGLQHVDSSTVHVVVISSGVTVGRYSRIVSLHNRLKADDAPTAY